ncbi:MAG TPA: GNAT family protein, partial [Candidatus Aquilonibacter sp.]|nr:GNAT family protein [Candidatus Aquilonibacter sp.]
YTAQVAGFESDERARAWLGEARSASDQIPFAIVDSASREAIGSTRYADIQPVNRKVEIGWTFIAKRFWRTHVNTECKFLLLRYAFEEWGAVRVSLKANAINQRSRTAIERIGATYEGTLRNFRMNPRTGTPIDSSYYSIVDTEWPGVKARLEAMTARARV